MNLFYYNYCINRFRSSPSVGRSCPTATADHPFHYAVHRLFAVAFGWPFIHASQPQAETTFNRLECASDFSIPTGNKTHLSKYRARALTHTTTSGRWAPEPETGRKLNYRKNYHHTSLDANESKINSCCRSTPISQPGSNGNAIVKSHIRRGL